MSIHTRESSKSRVCVYICTVNGHVCAAKIGVQHAAVNWKGEKETARVAHTQRCSSVCIYTARRKEERRGETAHVGTWHVGLARARVYNVTTNGLDTWTRLPPGVCVNASSFSLSPSFLFFPYGNPSKFKERYDACEGMPAYTYIRTYICMYIHTRDAGSCSDSRATTREPHLARRLKSAREMHTNFCYSREDPARGIAFRLCVRCARIDACTTCINERRERGKGRRVIMLFMIRGNRDAKGNGGLIKLFRGNIYREWSDLSI